MAHETERRKSHIDITHPLLPIATDCLSYNEEDKPSAQQPCQRLAALEEASQYGDSVQQIQERRRVQSLPAYRDDRERQIRELQQDKKKLQQDYYKTRKNYCKTRKNYCKTRKSTRRQGKTMKRWQLVRRRLHSSSKTSSTKAK